jgi:hypothetical protein
MFDKTVRKRNAFFKKRRLGDDETASTHQAWAELRDEENFTQVWQMVRQAHLIQGGDLDELRFQRSVAIISRKRG